MKIAIIGSGIAGLTVAYRLHKTHDIMVFEANDYIGGHTNTIDVEAEGRSFAVDTGFIVFNDWTYPNFISLLEELGVASQPSSMGFSVKCEKTGLEYCGSSLNGLFGQRKNILSPSFYKMLYDIFRFNQIGKKFVDSGDMSFTLGEFLNKYDFGERFRDHYLIPMGAAIWSTDPIKMFSYPANTFLRFLNNHGLLNINDRPQWRVISGGSREYVKKMISGFSQNIYLNTPVQAVTRHQDNCELKLSNGTNLRFDHVFFACHSDQALNLLTDAHLNEREILSSIPYQENSAVLHTDQSALPRRKNCWAAWNYHISPSVSDRVVLTYNMNILQSLSAKQTFCVSLNYPGFLTESQTIKRIIYHHPVFLQKGIKAQSRHHEISGHNRTHYCGAYWRYGFHEDGVVSALNAIKYFNKSISRT
jgi:predicted NAD/FAD-binding protein